MKKWRRLAAGLVLAAVLATPAAAKEAAGKLNPPVQAPASAPGESPYTSSRIMTPLAAPRPAGDLKTVTRDGYSFQMPAVWQMPEGTVKAAFDGILSAREQEVSGVAFFTFDGKTPDLPQDMEVEGLLAPIGPAYRATGKVESKAGAAKMVLYYPARNPEWGIAAVSVGEDSAPTAEETAAYMVYTLTKNG